MDAIDHFSGQYRFLSNFWPCRPGILLHRKFCGDDNCYYPTVEHAYQASKTLDSIHRDEIFRAVTAGLAKALGKRLRLRSDWDHIKIPIMSDYLRQKFRRDPLRKSLLDTKDRELIEGNHWGDEFWGVCNGKGLNHLGQLLMIVRRELRDQSVGN